MVSAPLLVNAYTVMYFSADIPCEYLVMGLGIKKISRVDTTQEMKIGTKLHVVHNKNMKHYSAIVVE